MTFAATLPRSYAPTAGRNTDTIAMPTELTVAQAAALLEMSEVRVNELLSIDALKYRQVGTQRLIDRDELLEYKEERERGAVILTEMCQMSQEMGLYND